jgi:tetratricopeptide (TPR) repeat protein/WD40 repeat protein
MSAAPADLAQRLEGLPKDAREIALRDLPAQLAEIGRVNDLRRLLTSFGFLSQKLAAFGVDAVAADVDRLAAQAPKEEVPALRSLQSVLRLAAPALRRDPHQFASQLSGRLMTARFALLGDLTAEAAASLGPAGLRPLTPSLTQGSGTAADVLDVREEIAEACLTNDGTRLVTGSASGKISVWRLPLRADSRLLTLTCPEITALCVTPDDRFLIAAARPGTLVKWELASGFESGRTTLDGVDVISSLAAEGELVLAQFRDGVLAIDVDSLEVRSGVALDVVDAIQLLPDAQFVTGTTDGFIDLRALPSGELICTLGWHGAFKEHRTTSEELFIRMMARTPMYGVAGAEVVSRVDGRMHATVDTIPNISERERLRELLEEDPVRDAVGAMAADTDGAPMLVSGCFNGELALIDWKCGGVIRRFRRHKGGVTCCVLSTKSGRLVSGSYDGSVRVWDMNTGIELCRLVESTATVTGVFFTRGASQLLAVLSDGHLFSWDREQIERGGRPGAAGEAIRALAVAGPEIFAVSDSEVTTFDAGSHAVLARRKLPELHRGAIALTPDGRRAVSARGTQAIVWDMATGWPLATLAGAWDEVSEGSLEPWRFEGLALASDLRHMLSIAVPGWIPAMTAGYGQLELWNIKQRAVRQLLDARAGYVPHLVASPDGRWAATAGSRHGDDTDGETTLRIWDLEAGACARTFVEPNVSCLAFDAESALWWRSGPRLRRCRVAEPAEPHDVANIDSTDPDWSSICINTTGRAVVVTGGDTLELWDLTTAIQVGTLTLDADVSAVALSRDTVVAGDRAGHVHFLSAGNQQSSGGAADEGDLDAVLAVVGRDDVPTHEQIDAARRLARSREPTAALAVWRRLALDESLSVDLRSAIASTLSELGDFVSSDAVLGAIAERADVAREIRLAAARSLRDPLKLVTLPRWAQDFVEAFHTHGPAAPSVRIFCVMLERIGRRNDGGLTTLAADARLPAVARVAAAQTLGRSARGDAAGLLERFATDEATAADARAVALDGLRHLVPALRWIETAARALRSEAEPRTRDAIGRMLLRVGRLDHGSLDLAAGYARERYDLEILGAGNELNNRAMAAAGAGDLERAADLLSRAIEAEPDQPTWWANHAGVSMRMERYAEAVRDASRALELDSQYEKPLNFRAYALLELGEYEIALEDLNRALRLNPGDVANLRNRAYCLRALGRLDEARRDAELAESNQRRFSDGDALEPFERSLRREPPDDADAELTAAVQRAALDLSRDAELLGSQVRTLRSIIDARDVLELAREGALAALGALGATAPLEEVSAAADVASELRLRAASERLEAPRTGDDEDERQRRAAAVSLRALVRDSSIPGRQRAEAAAALANELESNELIELACSITVNPGEDGRPSVDVWPMLELIRALGPRGERARLEALARNRGANAWAREIACEALGAYFDPASAVALLNDLAWEVPSDSALAGSIANARRHFTGGAPPRSEDEGFYPQVQEAFDAFVAAEDIDTVDELAEQYPFVTDPEFIDQVRQFVASNDSRKDRPLVEAKLQRLREVRPDLAQRLFRLFARTTLPEEMRDLAERYPVLTTPGFQQRLEHGIESGVPPADRAAYRQRLDWLRAVPVDERQVAVEAFMGANSPGAVRELAERIPFIRSSGFRALLEALEIDVMPNPPLAVRMRWLDVLPDDEGDGLYDAAVGDLADGDPASALEKIERLATLDANRRVDSVRGAALLDLGQEERAIEVLTRALEHRPSAMAFERRGKARLHLDHIPEALADFTQALELEPDYDRALVGRALARLRLEQWASALVDLERARQLAPTDELVAFTLATTYPMVGKVEQALDVLSSVDWSGDFRARAQEFRASLQRTGGDAAQLAFDAFRSARNDHELREALDSHPLLAHPRFIEELEAYIASRRDPGEQAGLHQRFDCLLSLVRNPAQLAYEAMMSTEPLANLLREHDFLREHTFLDQLEEIARSIAHPEMSRHLATRVRDLRRILRTPP